MDLNSILSIYRILVNCNHIDKHGYQMKLNRLIIKQHKGI